MPAQRGMRVEDEARQETPSPPPVVVVTFLAALLGGIAGAMASGVMAWIAIGAVACGGAYFASRASAPRKSMVDVARPRRLLLLLDRGGSAESKVPPEFAGDWATLYERVSRLAHDARSNAAPGSELDQFRKHADLAASLLRDGKDPLAEAPELRAGPLQSLLEGMRSSGSLPVVSRMRLGEEELIGEDGDTLPPDWPKPSGEETARPPGDITAFESGLKELIREIEALRTTLAGGPNGEGTAARDDAALRTPAQLVDAVVLNAAVEATRSGSEAFAAIAEETRRLAEFAREATDTISRLSSEIEYKVGETITAIHATSEDAKNSLAEMSGSAAPVPSSARSARVQVVRLLDRSRELLKCLGISTPRQPAENPPSAKDRNSTPDIVENGPPPADNATVAEGMLLIEGLKPGAHLES